MYSSEPVMYIVWDKVKSNYKIFEFYFTLFPWELWFPSGKQNMEGVKLKKYTKPIVLNLSGKYQLLT